MKLCTTCSREWDVLDGRCPADGTVLVSKLRVSAASGGAVEVMFGREGPEEELPPGTQVGEYEIERFLGSGGMGTVYGARHPLIGKRAAVKVLSSKASADHSAVLRFVQEAQAVNQIGHANIVDVFAFGTLPDGRSYFIMEWLQGETLGDRLERSSLSAVDAIPIVVALTRALEAAHAVGIVHRDLKPDNIFLISEDDSIRVKLLDFGIAKLSSVKAVASKTATGIAMGTPLYMSPEQARGSEVDARADLYALGVVAYEMVCGHTPFEDEASAVEVLGAHIAKAPVAPRVLVPDLPESFEGVVLDLLAKDPAHRPALSQVRWRLTRLATNPSISAGFSEHDRDARSGDGYARASSRTLLVRRPKNWRRVAAAVVAVVAATCGGYLVASRTTPERPEVRPPISVGAVASTAQPSSRPVSSVVATEPAPRGSVEISVEPATATVTVDGNPLELRRGSARLELAPGWYEAKASAPRRRTARERFEVVASKTTNVTLGLKSSASAKRATNTDNVINPFAKKSRPR